MYQPGLLEIRLDVVFFHGIVARRRSFSTYTKCFDVVKTRCFVHAGVLHQFPICTDNFFKKNRSRDPVGTQARLSWRSGSLRRRSLTYEYGRSFDAPKVQPEPRWGMMRALRPALYRNMGFTLSESARRLTAQLGNDNTLSVVDNSRYRCLL